MSSFIDKDTQITFSNVTKGAITKTAKYGLAENGNFADAGEDGVVPFINGVEVDWNGATTYMGEEQKVINTTGDLISYLATAYTNAYTAVTSSGGADVDTINNLIQSKLNKIPLSATHIIPSSSSQTQQDFVLLGGLSDNSSAYLKTSQVKLNAIYYDSESAGVPNNAKRLIQFSYAKTNNSVAECGYFDGLGYLHLKDINFNSLYNKFYDIGQSLSNKADNYTVSTQISTINNNINKLTPQAHQSGNSGYIIAYDTTTGNLFKSLATVDDTGVYFTSDISLKENIEQIIDSEIDKLFETESGNMYSFDWKDSHEHSFGFIAQELEQFAPEAVHEFDGIKKVNYEVALTKICAAMFKKIKQLEARIDELEK